MTEIVSTGLIERDKLASLIADCHFSPQALFLAERLPTHVIRDPKGRRDLLRFEFFNEDLPFLNYTSGRIFQSDAELRWERQSEQMRVVYLGSQERDSVLQRYGLETQCELTGLQKEHRSYYLFGERLRPDDLKKIGPAAQPGDFADVRIPRFLRYPLKPNNARYACLGIYEYSDAATGQVMWFRFQSLEPAE